MAQVLARQNGPLASMAAIQGSQSNEQPLRLKTSRVIKKNIETPLRPRWIAPTNVKQSRLHCPYLLWDSQRGTMQTGCRGEPGVEDSAPRPLLSGLMLNHS